MHEREHRFHKMIFIYSVLGAVVYQRFTSMNEEWTCSMGELLAV